MTTEKKSSKLICEFCWKLLLLIQLTIVKNCVMTIKEKRNKTSTDSMKSFSFSLLSKVKLVWEKESTALKWNMWKGLGWAVRGGEELTTVIPRSGSRISTNLFPTWAATSRPPTVLHRRSADALWRFLIALVAAPRLTRRRAWAVTRWRAGPPLLAARTSVFVRFTLSLRVEILAVSMTQLPLLSTQLQSQLTHFFFSLLLLLHESLDPLGLGFLVSFVC